MESNNSGDVSEQMDPAKTDEIGERGDEHIIPSLQQHTHDMELEHIGTHDVASASKVDESKQDAAQDVSPPKPNNITKETSKTPDHQGESIGTSPNRPDTIQSTAKNVHDTSQQKIPQTSHESLADIPQPESKGKEIVTSEDGPSGNAIEPSVSPPLSHANVQQHTEYHSHPDIEVDSNPRTDNSDADSALGSMPASSTVSLRESVFSYIEENGRTYHAFHAGKYIGPNDEREQERLDLQHHLFVMTMDNKLHLAPIKNPQNVLDIATGTGIWAIEFAEEYPSAVVLGTDLSPIQPAYVPPNCRFEINDAEEEWIFTQQFDYVHGRALVSCFRDPPSVISSIFQNLTPGGWFEFQDPIMPLKSIDGTLEGTALDEFQKSCMEAAALLGRPWTNGKNYGRWMREQGFEDVTERSYYWATNQWVKGRQQKLQALWLQENLKEGLPAWGLSTLSRGLGWSRERIEVLIARAREDLKNPAIHAYAECYVAYGRKPGGAAA